MLFKSLQGQHFQRFSVNEPAVKAVISQFPSEICDFQTVLFRLYIIDIFQNRSLTAQLTPAL